MVGTSPTVRPPCRARVTAPRTSATDSTGSSTRLSPVGRSAAMRTIGIVQAVVRDQQLVDDLARQDRPVHDPGHVLDLDPAVPDPLRIDHHGRTMFALLQAARVVGAHERAEAGPLELPFERLAERLLTLRVAAAPLVSGFSNIPADEDVVGERRHFRSLGPRVSIRPADEPPRPCVVPAGATPRGRG